jgi:hypothetical protein
VIIEGINRVGRFIKVVSHIGYNKNIISNFSNVKSKQRGEQLAASESRAFLYPPPKRRGIRKAIPVKNIEGLAELVGVAIEEGLEVIDFKDYIIFKLISFHREGRRESCLGI